MERADAAPVPPKHGGKACDIDTSYQTCGETPCPRDCIMGADSTMDQMHYVANAARKEREAGLDHFPEQVFGMSR